MHKKKTGLPKNGPIGEAVRELDKVTRECVARDVADPTWQARIQQAAERGRQQSISNGQRAAAEAFASECDQKLWESLTGNNPFHKG